MPIFFISATDGVLQILNFPHWKSEPLLGPSALEITVRQVLFFFNYAYLQNDTLLLKSLNS